jgi:DNA-binding MarR family transcriptional regulator
MLTAVGGFADRTLPAALAVYRRRLMRRHYFPDIFGEPGWDMLLLLAGEGPQSVSALSVAGGTSSTTGLRWIERLSQEALVERLDDRLDARRQWIRLTAAGWDALASYFRRIDRGVEVPACPQDALIEIARIANNLLEREGGADV